MANTEATESTTDYEEGTVINYIVNITNPSNCTITINQTGKPVSDDPPPGKP